MNQEAYHNRHLETSARHDFPSKSLHACDAAVHFGEKKFLIFFSLATKNGTISLYFTNLLLQKQNDKKTQNAKQKKKPNVFCQTQSNTHDSYEKQPFK